MTLARAVLEMGVDDSHIFGLLVRGNRRTGIGDT